jgi:hypothetical protein
LFSNGFRKIYSYHLKKCGGTSLNRWIEQHVDDYRRWDEALYFRDLRDAWGFKPGREKSCAGVFHWSDAIYTHVPLGGLAPEGTFCLVVLRDPISRIVSQVADWRRDAVSTHHSAPDDILMAMRDAAELPLRKFLERHGHGKRSYLFDNYQTRALAARYPERESGPYPRALDILPDALTSLHSDYDLVGIQEQGDLVRAAMSSRLGLPYETHDGDRLNVTNSLETMGSEIDDAADILQELTSADDILYRAATEVFISKHQGHASLYSEKQFERRYAADAVARLRPNFQGGDTVFSVRDPLVASGLHGRDAAGSSGCTVWSGPGSRFVLYMPVPVGADLTLKLWLRGAASTAIMQNIKAEVDDEKADHVVSAASGWAATITVRSVTKRPFIKLAIDVNKTVASPANTDHVDQRKRGIAFGAYGWSFNT